MDKNVQKKRQRSASYKILQNFFGDFCSIEGRPPSSFKVPLSSTTLLFAKRILHIPHNCPSWQRCQRPYLANNAELCCQGETMLVLRAIIQHLRIQDRQVMCSGMPIHTYGSTIQDTTGALGFSTSTCVPITDRPLLNNLRFSSDLVGWLKPAET
eukprot:scaffold282392_cov18-Tisochrysis_lutea.AAC.2